MYYLGGGSLVFDKELGSDVLVPAKSSGAGGAKPDISVLSELTTDTDEFL